MTTARDMTKRQFKERLKHYGIRQVLMWFDRPDLPGVSIGAVLNMDGKMNRRATLAKIVNFKRPAS